MDELRKRLKEIASEMEEINKKEDLTKEDEERFDQLKVEFREVRDKIEAEDKKDQRVKEIEEVKNFLNQPQEKPQKPEIEKESGFRSFGEFVQAVRFNPADPRLVESEERALSVGTDTKGGYLIPDEFISRIRMVSPQEAIVRPRASVIPAGDIPDQKITMPALDQTATDGTGIYGGVSVSWIEEGETKPETDTGFNEISLEPKEVAGHIVVTDKLLRNAPAVEGLITQLFRGAINSAEEDAFFNSAVATRPTGIISHAGTITVNRSQANRIVFSDVVNMLAKKLGGGNYVWVASISTLPQLIRMKDFEAADSDAPNLVWQPDARAGMPGTILGIPVLFSDQLPTLGNKGDLILANFTYYLIKDGYGIAIDASPHVYFTKNKTVIKAFWNVDGKPWLTAPITLRDGSTKVSPFVVLDVPSTSS